MIPITTYYPRDHLRPAQCPAGEDSRVWEILYGTEKSPTGGPMLTEAFKQARGAGRRTTNSLYKLRRTS